MYIRFLRRLALTLCALYLLVAFNCPAFAAEEVRVVVNGRPLTGDAVPFIQDGASYVPLAAFARTMGQCAVTWDGAAAHVSAQGLSLTAIPGAQWIQANDRYLYVPGGVRLVEGRTMVPLRTLAQIYGLEVTWNAADSTASASGSVELLEPGRSYYDPQSLYWLSRIISAESRGEPLAGQIAVGNVVLNRVASPLYPDTIYQVIFQPGQFEPVENGTIYQEPTDTSVVAAKLCLEGAQVVGECMYFFAPALSAGSWIVSHRTYYTTIGNHQFYL